MKSEIEPFSCKKYIFHYLLIFVIMWYESSTNEFSNYFLKREKNEKNENYVKNEKHFCDRKIRLADYDQFPIIYLNSFPGSGNT
mgnify:CR=1 FL=1